MLLFAFIFTTLIFANTEDDVLDVANAYNNKKNAILIEEKNKRQALGELYEINQKTKKIAKSKSDLTGEKLKIQRKISDLAKSIIGLEEQSKLLKLRLGKRLKEIYKVKGMGFFYALFSATSIHDLDKSLFLIERINDFDKNLQQDYKISIKNLMDEKEELKKQIVALENSRKKIQSEEQAIVSSYQERKKILTKIEGKIVNEKKNLEILRHRGINLSSNQKDLALLFQKPIFEMKGKLESPVKANKTRDFAIFSGLIDGVLIQHKGWFFSGLNIDVHSVYEGQIVFVGSVPGFGNTVIINHGDDYYSVYSHLKTIQVTQGQYIQQSATIGIAGDFSRWSGPGLYFEIRHFSEPEDPEFWIAPNKLNITEVTSN